MKKKILLFILFVSIFSLTGCDAKYNVEIKGSKITENFSLNLPNTYSESDINKSLEYYGIDSSSGFTQKIIEGNSEKSLNLSDRTLTMNNYFNSSDSLLNTCYNSVSYLLEDNIYYIGTTKGFKCLTYDYMEIDSFKFSIKTYNKVYKNNADSIKNNVYTWNITSDNAATNNIVFVVSKNKYVWYYEYRYLFYGLATVGTIVIIIYTVIFIFKLFSKKANKI